MGKRSAVPSKSVYRFLSGGRSGCYSVWRGDQHLGYVTRIAHRITDRGVSKTVVAGWTPSTPARTDLTIAATRTAAAKALWAWQLMQQR